MADSFISPATAATINAVRRRMYATQLVIGESVSLVLARDHEQDGTWVSLPAQTVLIRRANRETQIVRATATGFTAADGEFRKDEPFDVKRGDRFTLPDGVSGVISGVPYERGGVVRAAFTLEG